MIIGVFLLGATAIMARAHHATGRSSSRSAPPSRQPSRSPGAWPRPDASTAGNWVADYDANGAAIYHSGANNSSCGNCSVGPKYAPHVSVTVSDGVLQLHTNGTGDACAMRQAAGRSCPAGSRPRCTAPETATVPWDWPAFWLKSTRLPWPEYGEINGEVDGWVVSHASSDGKVCASYHYGTPNPHNPQRPVNSSVTQCDVLASFAVGWHIFSAIWAPGIVKYYVDG